MYNSLVFSDIYTLTINKPCLVTVNNIIWHNPFYFVCNAASCYLFRIQWSTLYTGTVLWYVGDNYDIHYTSSTSVNKSDYYTSSTSVNKSDYYTEAALPWVYAMSCIPQPGPCPSCPAWQTWPCSAWTDCDAHLHMSDRGTLRSSLMPSRGLKTKQNKKTTNLSPLNKSLLLTQITLQV